MYKPQKAVTLFDDKWLAISVYSVSTEYERIYFFCKKLNYSAGTVTLNCCKSDSKSSHIFLGY